ncbi:hypothetical protein [Siminovitchia fortis]|nr:hypothetical protein [Siminovitchia fortis]
MKLALHTFIERQTMFLPARAFGLHVLDNPLYWMNKKAERRMGS